MLLNESADERPKKGGVLIRALRVSVKGDAKTRVKGRGWTGGVNTSTIPRKEFTGDRGRQKVGITHGEKGCSSLKRPPLISGVIFGEHEWGEVTGSRRGKLDEAGKARSIVSRGHDDHHREKICGWASGGPQMEGDSKRSWRGGILIRSTKGPSRARKKIAEGDGLSQP